MRVTISVPCVAPDPGLQTSTTPRVFHDADRLAAAVRDALGIEVPVHEGSLADAPASGYLVAFDLGRDVPSGIGRRIIAFDEDRSTVMKSVEAFDLAGAVEKHVYWQWRTGASPRAYGLIGRKDVAARIPARVGTGPYTSPRYGILTGDAPGDLVSLLAAYLRAYAQIVTVE